MMIQFQVFFLNIRLKTAQKILEIFEFEDQVSSFESSSVVNSKKIDSKITQKIE